MTVTSSVFCSIKHVFIPISSGFENSSKRTKNVLLSCHSCNTCVIRTGCSTHHRFRLKKRFAPFCQGWTWPWYHSNIALLSANQIRGPERIYILYIYIYIYILYIYIYIYIYRGVLEQNFRPGNLTLIQAIPYTHNKFWNRTTIFFVWPSSSLHKKVSIPRLGPCKIIKGYLLNFHFQF